MLSRSKRLFFHYGQLFFTYRIKYDRWQNTRVNNELWHIIEEWYVGISFNKKWFEKESFYYDGHTLKSITLCGIRLFKAYGYESESLEVKDGVLPKVEVAP